MIAALLSIDDAANLRLVNKTFAVIAGTYILPEVSFYMHQDNLTHLRAIAQRDVFAPNVKSITYFAQVYESPAVSFNKFKRDHERSVMLWRTPLANEPSWMAMLKDSPMDVEYEKYRQMVLAQDRIKNGMLDLECLKDVFARFTALRDVTMSSGNLFYEGCRHEKPSPYTNCVRDAHHNLEPVGCRHLEVLLEALAYNERSIDSLRAGELDWRFFDKSPTELSRLFQPLTNLQYLDLILCTKQDDDGLDVDDDIHKCRRFLGRGMISIILKSMPKLVVLCLEMDCDIEQSHCPAVLKDVISPGHHWPQLKQLNLANIECDRWALMDVLELHKDTLSHLCLKYINLGTTSWKRLLPDIRKKLYLEDACICGQLTGQSEDFDDDDAANTDPAETWDLYVRGIGEWDMRASVNFYCQRGGKMYPDVLPLTGKVVRKYFDQYVRCHGVKSEAEDDEEMRVAQEDLDRRMRDFRSSTLVDEEGSGWEDISDEDESDMDASSEDASEVNDEID